MDEKSRFGRKSMLLSQAVARQIISEPYHIDIAAFTRADALEKFFLCRRAKNLYTMRYRCHSGEHIS